VQERVGVRTAEKHPIVEQRRGEQDDDQPAEAGQPRRVRP
jgi:hypothetical protein